VRSNISDRDFFSEMMLAGRQVAEAGAIVTFAVALD
tara:strand:+ start:329 stop:436 length:108 start_codon:yes stop_codon:yes gene_type:complete